MKRILLFVAVILLASYTVTAENEHYRVNEAAVEQMFANAEHLTLDGLTDMNAFTGIDAEMSAKNPWVAWLLTYTGSVGICGIHRLYLGTKTSTFIIYFCTGGGCGIVQTIDWVLLLMGAINDDIRKYVDNDKFLMM